MNCEGLICGVRWDLIFTLSVIINLLLSIIILYLLNSGWTRADP